MIRGSGCSKSSLAKAVGAEVAVQQTDEKWHAAVARSTFASQNAQNTAGSDQFWTFWCSKTPRHCGDKHICKSKRTKRRGLGPILDVLMLKNATPLWREAHLQVKTHKTPRARTNFGRSDVQKCHAAVARSTFSSQNVQITWVRERFLKFRCPKMARRCGQKRICKSKCAKHHTLGPLFEVPMFKNGTPLWREAHLQVKMYKTPAFCSILKGFYLTS